MQSQTVTNPQEIIIQPPQKVVEISHPPIQVYKEAPTVTKIDSQKKVSTQQIVEIQQKSPQISQFQQVVSTPEISKVQVVSSPTISQVKVIHPPIQEEPKPIITQNYISVSESKTLPDINTSQISASKILPTKNLPKITSHSQVLPLKILPPIDASIKQNSSIVNIPQYKQVHKTPINNNNKILHISKASEDDF